MKGMLKCIYLVLAAAFITIAESSIGLTSRCCRLDTGHDIAPPTAAKSIYNCKSMDTDYVKGLMKDCNNNAADLLTKMYYYGKDVRCVVERTFLMI